MPSRMASSAFYWTAVVAVALASTVIQWGHSTRKPNNSPIHYRKKYSVPRTFKNYSSCFTLNFLYSTLLLPPQHPELVRVDGAVYITLWYGLGRPVITSEIGNWSVFVLLGWRFVFGIIMKWDGRELHVVRRHHDSGNNKADSLLLRLLRSKWVVAKD